MVAMGKTNRPLYTSSSSDSDDGVPLAERFKRSVPAKKTPIPEEGDSQDEVPLGQRRPKRQVFPNASGPAAKKPRRSARKSSAFKSPSSAPSDSVPVDVSSDEEAAAPPRGGRSASPHVPEGSPHQTPRGTPRQTVAVDPRPTTAPGGSVPQVGNPMPDCGPPDLPRWRGFYCTGTSIPTLNRLALAHPGMFDGFNIAFEQAQAPMLDGLARYFQQVARSTVGDVTLPALNGARRLATQAMQFGINMDWFLERLNKIEARDDGGVLRLAGENAHAESVNLREEAAQMRRDAEVLLENAAKNDAEAAHKEAEAVRLLEAADEQRVVDRVRDTDPFLLP